MDICIGMAKLEIKMMIFLINTFTISYIEPNTEKNRQDPFINNVYNF